MSKLSNSPSVGVDAIIRLILQASTSKKNAEKLCKGIQHFYPQAKLIGVSKKYEIQFETINDDMKPIWIFLLFKYIKDIQIV